MALPPFWRDDAAGACSRRRRRACLRRRRRVRSRRWGLTFAGRRRPTVLPPKTNWGGPFFRGGRGREAAVASFVDGWVRERGRRGKRRRPRSSPARKEDAKTGEGARSFLSRKEDDETLPSPLSATEGGESARSDGSGGTRAPPPRGGRTRRRGSHRGRQGKRLRPPREVTAAALLPLEDGRRDAAITSLGDGRGE